MKLKPDLVLAAALLFLPIGGLRAAETELAGALQKGLFEEEANHNLTAAKESYQAVVGKFDEDRKLAATAVFRLGECYRKEGKTAEANQQYERILREFSDQTDLVKSSQTALGPRAASAQAASPVEGAARSAESEEDAAIRSLTKFLQDSPDMINSDKGKDEMTPLQEAVSKGQMRVAAWLLEHKAEINFSNDKGTALHLAVASGNRSLSEFLLSHGANPNARGLGGQTPLQLAVSKRFKSICELLLKNKADVNARDNQQDTALLWATAPEGADLGIVELLLANKADPEACSALWHSAFHKNIEVAKCLLAHGANVNAPEKNPPLGRAIENGNKEMVELLLDHKADPNLRDWNKKNGNGMSMLASAIRNNRNSAIPPMLIAHGADVNRLDEGGESPLFWALDRANAPMVELLLKSKADPNLCVNKTPLLVYAVLMRNLPIAKLLVAHGADVNKNDAEGNSPLFCAIRQEHVPVDILELLLKSKADPNYCVKGVPLLVHAIVNNNLPVAELLVAHGADVNKNDGGGSSPLFCAILHEYAPIVELLLKSKADPNYCVNGMPPLIFALNKKNTPIAELLLAYGADVNKGSFGGSSLGDIFHNIDYFSDSALEFLLAHGADPNHLAWPDGNSYGSTSPLIWAIDMMHSGKANKPIVELFLKYGADPNRWSAEGGSPLGAAQGQPEILALLRAYGASEFASAPGRIVTTRKDKAPMLFSDFTQDAQGFNRYTLLDALQEFTFKFPDLARIVIHRTLPGKAKQQEIAVNLLKADGSIDLSKDLLLNFGDVIEIPERPHSLGETDGDLTPQQKEQLAKRSKRTVTFKSGDQSKEITVDYPSLNRAIFGAGGGIHGDHRCEELLRFLPSNADFSKVQVTRIDPASKQKIHYTADLAGGSGAEPADRPGVVRGVRPAVPVPGGGPVPGSVPVPVIRTRPSVRLPEAHGTDQVWLLDGDVIEIPAS